jgi:hypothetical protein
MAADPKTPIPDEEGVKPFAAIFQEHRNGSVHDDASKLLAEVVQACVETGKKGQLSIKVTISPKADSDYLEVAFDVEPKTPRHGAKPSIFYATKGGSLLRENPRQMRMGIREVPMSITEPTPDAQEATS